MLPRTHRRPALSSQAAIHRAALAPYAPAARADGIYVLVDWDRSGLYETDITGEIELPGGGITIDRGFDTAGLYRAMSMSIVVSNRTGTYSHGNTASARNGQLVPRVPVKVEMCWSGVTYTLATGFIQTYRVTGVDPTMISTCTFTCTDVVGLLADVTPIDVLLDERTTSEAYEAVIDAAGLVSGDYSFPAGAQTLRYHWSRGSTALAQLAAIRDSELGGRLWVDALGVLHGSPRTAFNGISPTYIWGDGTTIAPRSAIVEIRDEDVVSRVDVQCTIMSLTTPEQVIDYWSRNMFNETPDSLALAAGETYEVVRTLPMMLSTLSEPDAQIDYMANDAIDGSGVDRTSSLEVTLTALGAAYGVHLRNTYSSTIYVTLFQVRGVGPNIAYERPVFTFTRPIAGDKTSRGLQLAAPFVDDETKARDYAVQMLRTFNYAAPRLILTFDANTATKRAAFAGLELCDQIYYKDTALGASGTYSKDYWYVERIQYQIPANWAKQTWRTVVTLVPSYLFRRLDYLRWDSFDRANAVGDLGTPQDGGAAWANDANMDISSNAARANSDTLQMPTLALGAVDHVVEVDLAAIGTGDEVGVVLRYVDADNQLRVYIDKGDNKIHIEKNVAAVVTEISTGGAGIAFTVGTSHIMRVMVQSTRIRVWVDRVPYDDVTDSSLTTGTVVGLFARNANATTTFKHPYAQGL